MDTTLCPLFKGLAYGYTPLVLRRSLATCRYVRLEEVQLGLGSPPRGFYDSAQLGRWRGCDVGLYRHVHDAAVLLEARVMGRIGIHPYITTCHGVLRDAGARARMRTFLGGEPGTDCMCLCAVGWVSPSIEWDRGSDFSAG